MLKDITPDEVRERVEEAAKDVEEMVEARTYAEVHDCALACNEEMFSDLVGLVGLGSPRNYSLQDMLDTIQRVGAVLKVAEEDSFIEDDQGLWIDAHPYGIPAEVAFWSLEHVLMDKLNERGNLDEEL